MSSLSEVDNIRLTCLSLAASAYEDVEWISKLVSWVADIATSRPHIKIIGMPKTIKFT